MNNLLRWFANNHVAANIFMLTLLLFGYICFSASQKEILPNLKHDSITINITADGLGSEAAERLLCQPIEKALQGIHEIYTLQSEARQNQCNVLIQSHFKSNKANLLDAVQSALARVVFPDSAKQPLIQQSSDEIMVARLTVSGSVDYRRLRIAAEKVTAELTALGLSHVVLRDAKNYRVFIEIPEYQLYKHQLNLADIARQLKNNQHSQAAGIMQERTLHNPIVVGQGIHESQGLAEHIIKAYSDGSQLQLQDIAKINDEFSDGSLEGKLDGQAAISISVYQQADKSITEIADSIQRYMATAPLAQDIQLDLVQDNSLFFSKRMQLLQNNALIGLACVFICLMLFLRLRVAFWVSMGIPVSFMASFIVLYAFGYSINMVSSFALLLVLGIIVDDAIIVAENIYQYQTQHPSAEAAVLGVQGIAKPVFFAAITTAISFSPLFFLPSLEGQLMSQIPIVVIACLFFSLIESLFILPAHLNAKNNHKPRKKAALQEYVQKKLEHIIRYYYQPLLRSTLRWRYAALTIFISLLLIFISLIISGRMPVAFLSDIESEVSTVYIRYPLGSDSEKIIAATAKIEKAAAALQKELLQQQQRPQILHIRSLIDDNGISANIFLSLSGGEQRKISGRDILQRLESKLGDFPQAEIVRYIANFNQTERYDIAVKLQANDSVDLYQATKKLQAYINDIHGSYNVHDSYNSNNRRFEVVLKPLAHDLAINAETIRFILQQAFIGISLDALQRGAYEADIVLRLPESERNSLWHLENLSIALPDGSLVPLKQLATIQQLYYSDSIQRLNGKRVSFINANINSAQINKQNLQQHISTYFEKEILPYHPSVILSKAHSSETEDEIKQRLVYGFIAAILMMFFVMAVLFGSYAQPLMILTAVPFGIIGAIAGHMLLGQQLTVWSMAGVIAVSGIVVNDNIVLVHFINQRMTQGQSVSKAILAAGKSRFRPILLTTITTFFGLVPIMFEKSFEAQFLIPMAISISFGVLFATFISLLLVPAMYLIGNDMQRLTQRYVYKN